MQSFHALFMRTLSLSKLFCNFQPDKLCFIKFLLLIVIAVFHLRLAFRFLIFLFISQLSNHRPLSTERPVTPSAPSLPVDNSDQQEHDSPSITRRARVLYDYDAADSSELSLLADEVCLYFLQPLFHNRGSHAYILKTLSTFYFSLVLTDATRCF